MMTSQDKIPRTLSDYMVIKDDDIQKPDHDDICLKLINEETMKKITLKGVDHLLELFQRRGTYEREFIKIIKAFLNDPIFQADYQSTVNQRFAAIKSFFKENDSPISFSFNLKRFSKTNGDDVL